MVNNCTKINNTNNHLSPSLTEHKLVVDEMMMMPALSYFDGRLSCYSVNLCPLNSNTVVIVLTSVHSTQTQFVTLINKCRARVAQ